MNYIFLERLVTVLKVPLMTCLHVNDSVYFWQSCRQLLSGLIYGSGRFHKRCLHGQRSSTPTRSRDVQTPSNWLCT